ncbi:hypothetical protein MARINON1_20541 [Marinobacter salarius]|nr:hypothetical protein MARINON1_20541 [Marinobacter salarius]
MAGEQFYQRGFSGAVVPDQPNHLTMLNGQVDRMEQGLSIDLPTDGVQFKHSASGGRLRETVILSQMVMVINCGGWREPRSG